MTLGLQRLPRRIENTIFQKNQRFIYRNLHPEECFLLDCVQQHHRTSLKEGHLKITDRTVDNVIRKIVFEKTQRTRSKISEICPHLTLILRHGANGPRFFDKRKEDIWQGCEQHEKELLKQYLSIEDDRGIRMLTEETVKAILHLMDEIHLTVLDVINIPRGLLDPNRVLPNMMKRNWGMGKSFEKMIAELSTPAMRSKQIIRNHLIDSRTNSRALWMELHTMRRIEPKKRAAKESQKKAIRDLEVLILRAKDKEERSRLYNMLSFLSSLSPQEFIEASADTLKPLQELPRHLYTYINDNISPENAVIRAGIDLICPAIPETEWKTQIELLRLLFEDIMEKNDFIFWNVDKPFPKFEHRKDEDRNTWAINRPYGGSPYAACVDDFLHSDSRGMIFDISKDMLGPSLWDNPTSLADFSLDRKEAERLAWIFSEYIHHAFSQVLS